MKTTPEVLTSRLQLATASMAALAEHELRSSIEIFFRRAGVLDKLHLRDVMGEWLMEIERNATEQAPSGGAGAQRVRGGRTAMVVEEPPFERLVVGLPAGKARASVHPDVSCSRSVL